MLALEDRLLKTSGPGMCVRRSKVGHDGLGHGRLGGRRTAPVRFIYTLIARASPLQPALGRPRLLEEDTVRLAASVWLGVFIVGAGALGRTLDVRPRISLEQITQVRTLGDFAISHDGKEGGVFRFRFLFRVSGRPQVWVGEQHSSCYAEDLGDNKLATVGWTPKSRPVFSPNDDRLAFELTATYGSSRSTTDRLTRDDEPCVGRNGDVVS